MSKRLTFAVPGDLSTPSGGYGYDRRLMAELRAMGWTVEHLALEGSYPLPSEEEVADAHTAFSEIPDGARVLVDGLALGTLPEPVEALAARCPVVALIHHPLGYETGLSESKRALLVARERRALAASHAVVVTSPATARTLADDFAVPAERITIALPGTEKAEPARGGGARPVILSIGTQIPRKDHATLVSALARLTDRDWHCRIVGSDTADPDTAAALKTQIAESGLGDRITLTGAMDDVAPLYPDADIFALASRYEGYGMVFAEALAHGLPIVACRAGAIPDVTGEEAAILCPPGDAHAFVAALATLLDDPSRRERMAAAAFERGRGLPSWQDTARIVASRLEARTR